MNRLTVGLLVPGTGTWTAELLWLAPPVVGNEEGSVVGNEGLLELVLGVLVDELLVVGDLWELCVSPGLDTQRPALSLSLRIQGNTYDRLGDGLSDGVNLGSVTTTGDANSDVNALCITHPLAIALVSSCPYSNFFSRLILRTELVETEDEERLVDLEAEDLWLDESERLAVDLDEALARLAVGDSGGGLLLAEALDALGGRHVGRCGRGVAGIRGRRNFTACIAKSWWSKMGGQEFTCRGFADVGILALVNDASRADA